LGILVLGGQEESFERTYITTSSRSYTYLVLPKSKKLFWAPVVFLFCTSAALGLALSFTGFIAVSLCEASVESVKSYFTTAFLLNVWIVKIIQQRE
jgi:hypothetical protein